MCGLFSVPTTKGMRRQCKSVTSCVNRKASVSLSQSVGLQLRRCVIILALMPYLLRATALSKLLDS